MLKKVKIRITTDRADMQGSLFEEGGVRALDTAPVTHEEMTVQGRYRDDGTRITLGYEEDESLGLEGSRVTISFAKSEPNAVQMLRTGSVKTTLMFKPGMKHECVYQTPLMPFDVRLQTLRVDNRIALLGTLYLEYVVEIKGGDAEHRKMRLTMVSYE